MVTLHSKMLVSSTKPAENPSTGCLQRSEMKVRLIRRVRKINATKTYDEIKRSDEKKGELVSEEE